MRIFKILIKIVITLSAIAFALYLGWEYYSHYMRNPWTRDGQIQAFVVGVAPRVSGPLINVPVRDSQFVDKGDLLFEIDPSDYKQELDVSAAALNKAHTTANLLRKEIDRRTVLMQKQMISLEDYQIYEAKYAEAVASIDIARANLELAQLNLGYTKVYAPISGYLTNLVVTNGTYVSKGQPLMAIVDSENFWVTGYFRETELKNIHVGKRAKVVFMGYEDSPVYGVVESVGWGIFREDGASANNLLPKVSPTVDWVRLAQRFPIRINLDQKVPDFLLRVGLTTSVMILPDEKEPASIAPAAPVSPANVAPVAPVAPANVAPAASVENRTRSN